MKDDLDNCSVVAAAPPFGGSVKVMTGIWGCYFHFLQAVKRHLKQYSGLISADEQEELIDILTQCVNAPTLNMHDSLWAYLLVFAHAIDVRIGQAAKHGLLVGYFQSQWGPQGRFPHPIWAHYPRFSYFGMSGLLSSDGPIAADNNQQG